MVTYYTTQEVDHQNNIKRAGIDGHSDLEEIHKKELDKVNKKMMEQEEIFKKTQANTINELEECEDNEAKLKQELSTKEAEINNLKSKIKECEKGAGELDKTKDELNKCKNDPNKCDKSELDKTKDELNKCKNDPNKCDKSELDKTKDALDKCKNDPNKCDKSELDKTKDELNKCKNDPNKCDKGEFDKTKDELNKCKNDPNKCDKGEFDKTKDELNKCKNDLSKCDKSELDKTKDALDKCKNDLSKCDKEKPETDTKPEPEGKPDKVTPNNPAADGKGCQDDGEPYTVVGKEITLKQAQPGGECGGYAGYYKSYQHVGHYGFNTACMLKKWFPEMYKDPIKAKIESIDHTAMPGNFKIAFTDDINYTWGKPSDMWCYPCKNYDPEKACGWEHNNQKAQSRCVTANSHWDPIYSHNFFSETNCPNLVSKEVHAREKAKEIYAKLVEPIVLYEKGTGKIITRDGEVTGESYHTCKQYINSNFTSDGKVAENSCNKPYYEAQCKSCTKALENALWTAKEPIKLKIPSLKEEASSYASSNHIDTQDSPTPYTSLDVL